MKITSTLEFSVPYLRRLVNWACQEIGMPCHYPRIAAFARSRAAWGGRAYGHARKVGVRVGDEDGRWPKKTMKHYDGFQLTFSDRIEILVWLTLHELAHLDQCRRRTQTRRGGNLGGSERMTEAIAARCLKAFRANREALLKHWAEAPEPASKEKPKEAVIEKRAAKAQADLARWQRKLKLAQSKVGRYKKRVHYYEKKTAAATREGGPA